MSEQPKVRIAVIGVGVMGSSHVRDIATRLPAAELAGVCDIIPERADRYAAEYHAPAYYDSRSLLSQADLDAVVIATPHYAHTTLSLEAFQRGLHVLTEKPLAAHARDGRLMLEAHAQARLTKPGLQFAIMFQMRTQGVWQKVKQMLETGELGKLQRVTWIITDWFRPQSYYDNGGWRATWKGEGGGVLLNQCPHNLDLYQWLFGMPRRVAGFTHLGKYHRIEVEDEVTGYFEHDDGLIGHFITTTAESPGTNRLEIAGELGKLVVEDDKLTFSRNKLSTFEFIRTSPKPFDRVECQVEAVPIPPSPESGYVAVFTAFTNAILHGGQLVVEASEGLKGLTLGNAIMLSSFLGRPVEMPFDEQAYADKLQELIRASEGARP